VRVLSVIIAVVFNVVFTKAQVTSPFNQKAVKASTGTYSFFVTGHLHGSSANQSGYPAATLLANLETINADSVAFIISTGDLFMDIRKNIPTYEKALFGKLTKPLFNAVGNHDLSGNIYEKKYGKTWFSFKVGSEKFIFLDTEINDGSIKGKQFEFFSNALTTDIQTTKNIFIVSHRPVWTEGDDKLENIFAGNTRSDFGNNFRYDIAPLLKTASKSCPIYWFSGSLGGNAPASFFYYKKEKNITYIQSAIRDLPRDGMLKVNVVDGQISFETISLTGKKMPGLEECGLNFWKTIPAESFNYRLIPLYTKQMLFHRYFWYGAAYAFAVVLLYYAVRKRLKRKKSA